MVTRINSSPKQILFLIFIGAMMSFVILNAEGENHRSSINGVALKPVHPSPRVSTTINSFEDQRADQAMKEKIADTYGALPLSFEVNQGQTDSQVDFLSRGDGFSLFLTSTEAVLVLNKSSNQSTEARKRPMLKIYL